MSNVITKLRTEKESLEDRTKEQQIELERLQRECDAFDLENSSLSLQIKNLLHKQYDYDLSRNPNIPNPVILDPFEDGKISNKAVSDAVSVVRVHLTIYDSIDSLQEQNRKLLRVVKELSVKMEQNEHKQRKELEIAQEAAINEAQELIEALRNEVKLGRTRIESYARECEMLRNLLEHQKNNEPRSESVSENAETNADYSLAFTELQANFDMYRREAGVDLRSLRQQLDESQKEASALKVKLANSNAQLSYQEERYSILQNNIGLQKNETRHLQHHIAELQKALGKQELVSERATQDILDYSEQVTRFKTECSNLKMENELLKSSETRIQKEYESSVKERENLGALMRDLQVMNQELQKVELNSRNKLSNKIEESQQELNDVKQKLSLEIEAHRTLALKKEAEAKEYQLKFDEQHSRIAQLREQLSASDTTVSYQKGSILALENQISILNMKLDAIQKKRNANSDLTAEEDNSSSLEMELDSAKTELEKLKGLLLEKDQHVEQFRVISETSEFAHKELQTVYDDYKKMTEEKMSASENKVASLTQIHDESVARLSEYENELAQQKAEFNTRLATLEEEKEALELRLKNSKASEKAAIATRTKMQEDVKLHAQQAQEASDRFNQELLSHASSVERLTALRKENTKLSESVSKLKNEAEKAKVTLKTSEGSWDNQKAIMQRSIEELQSRCSDLEELNNRLHSDYENVKGTMSKLKEYQAEDSSDFVLEVADAQMTVENLRGVVELLRGEVSRSELQRDLAQKEARRMQQELNLAQKTLEQTRDALNMERKRLESTLQSQEKNDELLARINELSILRESNVTLRSEMHGYTKKILDLEYKIVKLRGDIGPLKSQLFEAQSTIEVMEEEKKLLADDRDYWRERTSKILSNKKVIDPNEFEQLKADLDTQKEQVAKLEEEMASEKQKYETETASLQGSVDTLTDIARKWREKFKKKEDNDREIKRVEESNTVIALYNEK